MHEKAVLFRLCKIKTNKQVTTDLRVARAVHYESQVALKLKGLLKIDIQCHLLWLSQEVVLEASFMWEFFFLITHLYRAAKHIPDVKIGLSYQFF